MIPESLSFAVEMASCKGVKGGFPRPDSMSGAERSSASAVLEQAWFWLAQRQPVASQILLCQSLSRTALLKRTSNVLLIGL
ncbi:hypothetical protein [Mesorhizobium ventifaucium]|uniref:hypothetical protein n=1 Tax=Mesorhizobium ventifaucium TaxID=666020 RepID=UPI0020A7ABC7|nr:hypothetical protein [Mesorhizobium ventifaucium]